MSSRSTVSKFTADEVCKLLLDKIVLIGPDTIDKFKKEKINGSAFLDLSIEDLKELTCTLGERKAIQKLILEFEAPRADSYVPTCHAPSSTSAQQASWLRPSTSSWFPQKFSFPKFSVSTQENIDNKVLLKSTRVNIVESLGHQMWSHTTHPTSEEYTEVCLMLVTKFPVLKDSVGNGLGSWKTQLRQWFSNKRRPSKRGASGKENEYLLCEPPTKSQKVDDDEGVDSDSSHDYDEELAALQ